MDKNDSGEFELVLGNRQLLSVFFIVVILLGVFFTMGYIVGRNSAPIGGADIANARKTDAEPLVVDAPEHDATSSSSEPSPNVAPASPNVNPTETAPQAPARVVPPKAPEPTPKAEPSRAAVAKSKPPEVKPSETKPSVIKSSEAKKREPEKPPVAATPPPRAGEQPASGETYLQLAATGQREAEIFVDELRKKGFKSRTTEIPERAGTFRVLVGPVDPADVNRMRTDLQGAGFPGSAAIRRTF